MNAITALFVADIEKYRRQHITEVEAVLREAGQPADVVEHASLLAGLRWDAAHPTYARRVS